MMAAATTPSSPTGASRGGTGRAATTATATTPSSPTGARRSVGREGSTTATATTPSSPTGTTELCCPGDPRRGAEEALQGPPPSARAGRGAPLAVPPEVRGGACGRRRQLLDRARRAGRLPRPQRRRQDHDAQGPVRPPASDRR